LGDTLTRHTGPGWLSQLHPAGLHVGVELWAIHLSALAPKMDIRCLSAAERARAGQLVHPADRLRYEAAHCATRHVLATYTEMAAGELQFAQGTHGKPYLVGNHHGPHFNLSHSGDWALLGISTTRKIGVDIEALRTIEDLNAMAEQVFTANELAAFTELPLDQQEACFLSIWTRKEACLKALGTGLSLSPQKLEVGVHLQNPVILTSTTSTSNSFDLQVVTQIPHWIGAVALFLS
jgi:4'-phosphopantetheinyl transferase